MSCKEKALRVMKACRKCLSWLLAQSGGLGNLKWRAPPRFVSHAGAADLGSVVCLCCLVCQAHVGIRASHIGTCYGQKRKWRRIGGCRAAQPWAGAGLINWVHAQASVHARVLGMAMDLTMAGAPNWRSGISRLKARVLSLRDA